MDKLLAMNTFVHIVEKGSLTAAAEALDKSLPSVVRTLAMLEEALDARLLNRSTRRIALTDEGRRYLERCRQILADIDEAEDELSSHQSEPRGHINVTAPVMFGKMHVAPAITAFLQRYERTQVDLQLLDRPVNLIEEGIDVAIRIGHLSESSMIAKPVGEIRRVLCASPDYLQNTPELKHPKDLSAYGCVRFTGLSSGPTWQFFENGQPLSIPIKGAFGSNHAQVAIDACEAGLGFGVFLSYQIEPLIKQGKLQIVLPEYEPPPIPINVMYTHAKLMSSRIRIFVDWMATRLKESL